LDHAAQGGGGVPIPGGVQKTCSCGTWGHGLAGTVVLGGWLDLMILEVFSNCNDSVILSGVCSLLWQLSVTWFPTAHHLLGPRVLERARDGASRDLLSAGAGSQGISEGWAFSGHARRFLQPGPLASCAHIWTERRAEVGSTGAVPS